MKLRTISIAAVALLVLACSGSPAAPPAGTPAATLSISALNNAFSTATLTAPADAPFAIEFENKDTTPHNVAIPGGPPGTTGAIFGGPATQTYLFPALPAGSYPFRCDVHPEMTGTITAN